MSGIKQPSAHEELPDLLNKSEATGTFGEPPAVQFGWVYANGCILFLADVVIYITFVAHPPQGVK